ncbi:hypothetical protein [Kineosporia mesophila]|uniref:hypothetical protein n=1 Tax=Kineosporia mesophila TaxID=566012 RepID=UPI001E653781|nr:hypothetical protein [Kineosporia mesophila]MCD5354194.1 hypothetical protein [Kineosporia mesophila]
MTGAEDVRERPVDGVVVALPGGGAPGAPVPPADEADEVGEVTGGLDDAVAPPPGGGAVAVREDVGGRAGEDVAEGATGSAGRFGGDEISVTPGWGCRDSLRAGFSGARTGACGSIEDCRKVGSPSSHTAVTSAARRDSREKTISSRAGSAERIWARQPRSGRA